MGLLTYCFYKNRTFRSRDNSKVPATTIVSREKVHILQALRGYWSISIFFLIIILIMSQMFFFFPFPYNTKGILCLRKNKMHTETDVTFSLKTCLFWQTPCTCSIFSLLSILLLEFKIPIRPISQRRHSPRSVHAHTQSHSFVSV